MPTTKRNPDRTRPARTSATATHPGTARLVIFVASASVNQATAGQTRGRAAGCARKSGMTAESPQRLSAAASTSARTSKSVCCTK